MSSVSMEQMNRNRNTMHMSTNAGDFPPQTKQEIAEQIRKSAALPLDEIWISGQTKYPCLAILVNGADACLTYFETEGVMSYEAGQKPLSFYRRAERNGKHLLTALFPQNMQLLVWKHFLKRGKGQPVSHGSHCDNTHSRQKPILSIAAITRTNENVMPFGASSSSYQSHVNILKNRQFDFCKQFIVTPFAGIFVKDCKE